MTSISGDKELEKMKQDESPKDSETPSAEEKEKETEAEDKAGGDAGFRGEKRRLLRKKEGSEGCPDRGTDGPSEAFHGGI